MKFYSSKTILHLPTSLERVLALAGYGVTVATCGEVGRERASENRFVAVVTDFKLPGLSGLGPRQSKFMPRMDVCLLFL